MDLFHKPDITKDKEYEQKKNERERQVQTAMNNVHDEKRGKILFWIMSMAGFLALLLIFNARNFSIWFIVLLFLWGAYLFNIRHSLSIGTFIFSKMIIFGIIVLLLSIMIIATVLPG